MELFSKVYEDKMNMAGKLTFGLMCFAAMSAMTALPPGVDAGGHGKSYAYLTDDFIRVGENLRLLLMGGLW